MTLEQCGGGRLAVGADLHVVLLIPMPRKCGIRRCCARPRSTQPSVQAAWRV